MSKPVLQIAHLTDLHLPIPQPIKWQYLANKRGLGALSWFRRRRFIHKPETLQLITEDIRRSAADHVVITGDLVNLGLPAELEAGALWLRDFGPRDWITFVPGNHDTLVKAPWTALLPLAPYMSGLREDGKDRLPRDLSDFPFVRNIGPMALISVNTGIPKAPGLATGAIGPPQMARLEKVLVETGNQGMIRVISIHHPPVPGTVSKRKSLDDGHEFVALLRKTGAELVIHGHGHKPLLKKIDGPDGTIPVIGAGSASATIEHHGRPTAQYHLYAFRHEDAKLMLDVEVRGFDMNKGSVGPLSRFCLTLPTNERLMSNS